MKQTISVIVSVTASIALCAVVLIFPTEAGALWENPCVNVYSFFAAAFFVMNTIGVLITAKGVNPFAKPYTKERPVIEKKKNRVAGVVMAFFEAPLLMTTFFINGGWKMIACSALYVGGSLILASLIGDFSVHKMRKGFLEQEQRELAEQIKKEEG